MVTVLLAGLFQGPALHGQTFGVQLEGVATPPLSEQVHLSAGGGLFTSFRLHHHLAVRTGVLVGAHSTSPGTELIRPVWTLGGYVLPTHVMRNGFAFKAGLTLRSVMQDGTSASEASAEVESQGLRLATRFEVG